MKKVVYRVKEIQLHKDAPTVREKAVWEGLDALGLTTCNLYNAALFVELSHCTATIKETTGEPLTTWEQEVEDNIAKFDIHFLSYLHLHRYMAGTKNPDYCNLPAQARNSTLKQAAEDFQDCLYAWESPNCLFKNGRSKVVFSSEECKIREEAGVHFLDLPLSNCSSSLCLGKTSIKGILDQIEATFEDNTITLKLILTDMVKDDAEDWED